jgi:hypothetical protein
MPPLTLAILASVLQMHGADATIASDNKGVDGLLGDVRGRLHDQVDPNAPRIAAGKYKKNYYTKGYYQSYWKSHAPAQSTPGPKPSPGTQPPVGAGRRS